MNVLALSAEWSRMIERLESLIGQCGSLIERKAQETAFYSCFLRMFLTVVAAGLLKKSTDGDHNGA